MSFVDEEDQCPEERVKNISVEIKKIGETEAYDVQLPSKKLLYSCQFIHTKLEKAQYQVKLIERQGKALTKVLSDQVIDFSDDKDINDGVYIHNVNISKPKSTLQENANNSIFSPSIIVLILLAFFQRENTVWILSKIFKKISGK